MSLNQNKKLKQILVQELELYKKLYGSSMNPDEIIEYPKSQYKKFIKDVVEGTIERNELIEETIKKIFK